MSPSVNPAISALESDIEASRARLDDTIDRIQDRLSVSGILDDMIGTTRRAPFGSVVDEALATVRRNPLPVLLVAAGLGWLVHRMAREAEARRALAIDADAAAAVPVLSTGAGRVYDPDGSTRHPDKDLIDPREAAAQI